MWAAGWASASDGRARPGGKSHEIAGDFRSDLCVYLHIPDSQLAKSAPHPVYTTYSVIIPYVEPPIVAVPPNTED